MNLSRMVALSIIYNFKEELHSKGFTTDDTLAGQFPFIKVQTKDQFYESMSVPCIVVYPYHIGDFPLQIGGGYWIDYGYNFDIYAGTDGEMLELTDLTTQFLQRDSNVLRYDEYRPSYQVSDGFVRSIYQEGTPSLVCSLMFEDRKVTFLDRFNTIGEMKAHASQVSVTALVPSS